MRSLGTAGAMVRLLGDVVGGSVRCGGDGGQKVGVYCRSGSVSGRGMFAATAAGVGNY